jgi:hypothetical protein
MTDIVKSAAQKIASLFGVYLVFKSDRNKIASLMRSLWPIDGGKALIRLGPDGDGGYLVPDDLDGIVACFSPGVSIISGFERDCAEKGMEVFMADRSVVQVADQHERFSFTRKFVGVTRNDDFMTFDNWVKSSIPDSDEDFVIQMDIEGFEYETILNMSDELMSRCRIFVVEFHNLNQLWNEHFYRIASRVFEKILQTHSCVHIHPNNDRPSLSMNGLTIPPLMEFTFLRNDRIGDSVNANIFPHALDRDCVKGETVVLPKCWYRS